jgi:phosphoglycerate dehydrogenase-like enzyme
MFKELASFIEKQDVRKEFRYLPEENVTQEDIFWADVLVAFHINSNYDFSQLKWIHSLGAGVDRFLLKNNWQQGVLLTRTICSFGQRIGEYCLSYVLKDLQFHDQFHELKEQKKWQPMTPKLLTEQKILIYGTGEIGQTVAKIFSGLGVEVYGVSLSGKEKEFFKEVWTTDSHVSRLPEFDYLINTMPLTERTVQFFNGSIFSHLTDTGFINVGRGASLDEHALLVALEKEQVRFAVLDVFNDEPLSTENPLWAHPNVQITPHISAVTTPQEGAACFLETLRKIEDNRPLLNKVDVAKGY